MAYADQWALGQPGLSGFFGPGRRLYQLHLPMPVAGIGVMNYTPTPAGIISTESEGPRLDGGPVPAPVLLDNTGAGPYAREAEPSALIPGDVIQLMNPQGTFYHSLFLLRVVEDEFFIATHTLDAYMRPLSSYTYYRASFLHILGGRADA